MQGHIYSWHSVAFKIQHWKWFYMLFIDEEYIYIVKNKKNMQMYFIIHQQAGAEKCSFLTLIITARMEEEPPTPKLTIMYSL